MVKDGRVEWERKCGQLYLIWFGITAMMEHGDSVHVDCQTDQSMAGIAVVYWLFHVSADMLR